MRSAFLGAHHHHHHISATVRLLLAAALLLFLAGVLKGHFNYPGPAAVTDTSAFATGS